MGQLGPTSFALISDLSSQAGSDGIAVTVNGKDSINDGFGDIYMFRASNTATPDGFNVIQVTGQPTGRWVRKMSAINIVSSAATLQINSYTSYYTFTGTTAVWTLPPLGVFSGYRLTLINQGTGNLTVNTTAGSMDIDDSGTIVNTISLAPGERYIFYNNSLKYTSLQ